LQHAEAIANALPADIQQTLVANGASMELAPGFPGGAEGENNGTQGLVYQGSGMADQALVHELYEMAGQENPSLAGSWGDSQAVGLSDAAMPAILNGTAPGGNPGDLNDTVGQYQGDGDLMSNAFVADFFATNPGLDQDSVGGSVLQSTEADAPQLEAYIAQAQGLTNVDG